jgi:excisionase family DNA binding protein
MTKAHFKMDGADPLMTTKDAANVLGVSIRTIQLWVEAGHLQAGRTPGGHRRIRKSAVTSFAEKTGLRQKENAKVETKYEKQKVLVCLANKNRQDDWQHLLGAMSMLMREWYLTTNAYETLVQAGTGKYSLIIVDNAGVDIPWATALQSIAGDHQELQWRLLVDYRNREQNLLLSIEDKPNVNIRPYPELEVERAERIAHWDTVDLTETKQP